MAIILRAAHRVPVNILLGIQLLILDGLLQLSNGNSIPNSSPALHPNLYQQYSAMSNQDIMSKLYSTFAQAADNLPSYEHQVKRSQEQDLQQLSQPSVQQLASSLLTESVTAVPGYEQASSQEQNYTLVDGNEYYQPSSVYGNYYLNPQYYHPVDHSSANSFALSPSVLEQYATLLQSNQSNSKHKTSKPAGLGRRIGELMSNSAERASRAFKSFSQFKLFNDIKPSRLLGLVSEQQPTTDPKAMLNSSAIAVAPSNGWSYYPASAQPWSSFVPPSPSSIFYQQPVYVRTQEMAAAAAASANSASPGPSVGPINSLISPSGVSAASSAVPLHGSKSSPEYMSPMSDFYPPKLPLDNSAMYQSVVNSQPSNPQYNSGASSTIMPVGTSTTTVYHHFANGESSQNSANSNNQQPQDLFASPQTQFGLRVKPPKDFEFDGTSEEEMQSSSEQDDSKMANAGSGGNSGGRNSMSNNDATSNSDGMPPHSSQGGGQSPWSGSSSFDDSFSESGNSMDPDMFNSFNSGNPAQHNGRHRFNNRPYHSERPVAPPREHSMERLVPFRTGHNLRPYPSGVRRPAMPMPEFDEPDNWYNTFFGSSVKPISRFRGFPFSSPSALNFMPHHHPHHAGPNMLNSAASTPTSTSLSPESFALPFMSSSMRPDGSTSPNYFHYPNAGRPSWPYNMYSQPASNPYFANFRPGPMMPAATSVRPVSMPFAFPQAGNYFVPRYPRSQSMYGTYPNTFAATFQPNPAAAMSGPAPTMMAPNPYTMGRPYSAMTPFSMMPAASSMYPVRVPFSPMMTLPAPMPFGLQPMPSTILPAIAQPPMLRYRYGPDLTPSPSRRTINITKRAETATDTMPMAEQTSNVLKKVNQVIASSFPSRESTIARSSEDNSKQGNMVVPNREEQNLATLYNAYQVLQRRMDNEPSEENKPNKPPAGTQQQPYYQYYIGKDATTVAGPMAGSDSSVKASSAKESVTIEARSLKTRHVQDQLEEHQKRQQQIRQYLTEASNGTSVNSTLVTSTTMSSTNTPGKSMERQAKSISQVMAPSEEWRPLLRVGSVRKRH